MEVRRVPGLDRPVSVLGVSLAPLVEGPPDRALGAPTIGFLRRARALGIRVYDVDAGDATPAAERALAAAFPEPDPELVVMGSLASRAAAVPDVPLSTTLEEFRHRLGGHPIGILWVPEGRLGRLRARRAELDELRRQGRIGAWGVAFDRPESVTEFVARGEWTGPALFRAPYDLLEPRAGRALLARLEGTDGRLVATDPHAQGLLDGSLLEPGAPLPPSPTERRAFEAVARRLIRLRPFTAGGARTLPEAAVQFAIAPPEVACTVLRTRRPELLETSVRALARPPLTRELLDRSLPDPGEPGGPGGPSPALSRPGPQAWDSRSK